MDRKPDLEREPRLEHWFPWDCPECGAVMWYLPCDELRESPCACYAAYLDASKAECDFSTQPHLCKHKKGEHIAGEAFQTYLDKSPFNQWWRVFAQAQYQRGWLDAETAVTTALEKRPKTILERPDG